MINAIYKNEVVTLEGRVKKCYESAPFPDTLRKAKDFHKSLDHITYWIKLNLEFLSKDLITLKPTKVLCAGCGTGEETLAISTIFPSSQIDAIDISDHSLQVARQNINRAQVKNITLKKCSIIDDLPLSRKKYDFIYCAGVIHHLANPKLGFKILVDKLNTKGKMVIMLYNSYGLFLYKCQLLLLKILCGDNQKKRLYWVKLLGFEKGKDKVLVYDSYINPQIKTFTIESIKGWAKEEKLAMTGIVPPLNLGQIIEFAVSGKEYFFRRQKLLSFILSILKLVYKKSRRDKPKKITLPFWKTFFYQIIFLLLGKGECQYLLEKIKNS